MGSWSVGSFVFERCHSACAIRLRHLPPRGNEAARFHSHGPRHGARTRTPLSLRTCPISRCTNRTAATSFLYRRAGNGVAVTASKGSSRADGLIEWVLGAGAQGQTPLVHAANGMLESRVSYFPQLHRYGITIGQNAGASANAQEALGEKQNAHALQSCLGCHATVISRDLQPVVPGVQCERCHAGADEHARGNGKLPLNPGKLDASAQVKFCGSCHRFKPPVDDAQLENVRFQPLRLMKSRCFASGKLACTTCHPAHQDARRNDPEFYNQKCHACHDGQTFHADQRQAGDCIGCHMPYVQLHPALNFTDHFIRVVKAGDLPPSVIHQRGSGS